MTIWKNAQSKRKVTRGLCWGHHPQKGRVLLLCAGLFKHFSVRRSHEKTIKERVQGPWDMLGTRNRTGPAGVDSLCLALRHKPGSHDAEGPLTSTAVECLSTHTCLLKSKQLKMANRSIADGEVLYRITDHSAADSLECANTFD